MKSPKNQRILSALFKSRLVFYSIFVIITTPLAYYTYNVYTSNTDVLQAIYRPDQAFQQDMEAGNPLEDKKSEILQSLNEELTQESNQHEQEDTRILAMLDNLWNSIQEVVSPLKKKKVPKFKRSPFSNGADIGAESGETENTQLALDTLKRKKVLRNVLTLASDDKVIYKAPPTDMNTFPKKKSHDYNVLEKRPINYFNYSGQTGAAYSDNRWISRFQSLEGFNTKSIIWRLHRRLELEGTWEATSASDTDPDLIGFGFRSVQALALLQDQALPPVLSTGSKIDSGYPLSYGIGLNLMLSPELNIHFDYSHEYRNEHLIEYNGNWESSLVTDYLMTKTEDVLSVHNFFFGFRYLHQNDLALIPLHTGFFYSTNMLNEPLSSKVSMGFSIGGGVNGQNIRLGIAYRLRLWERPNNNFLLDEEEDTQRDFSHTIANQLLFSLSF